MAWHKWITTERLIWCLSQCSTYIFIHSVWHSMDESTARVLSFADRRGDISIRRSSVYFDFRVYHPSHIHHIPVMNRHPAGSWYGKLDVLLFMKSAVFISHFYSWALDLTVNAFKTDSALLGSWIKAMAPIMTLLAVVCGQWSQLGPPGFSPFMRFPSAVSLHCPTHRDNISEPLVCTWHFTSL